ncbi:MAG: CinA-related protein [Gammaproteobacteria bacterium]|nr:MAG: CinA-related protein [Gammaproteobacteria bacterium]TND06675.1 MAG: CinA-related protein [Gammaproteobacteria bacterium]
MVQHTEANPSESLAALSVRVGDALRQRRWKLVIAESCTGGWVAQSITSVSGSSGWFDRGFITYSDESKQELLGVSADTLARNGAVSEQAAREMATGALRASHADISLAVTGIAGPGGGTPDKPVGTVCFAWADNGSAPRSITCHFTGDRHEIRRQSVLRALKGLLTALAERQR